ncbi:MAG: RND family transporter [Candidatus Caldatribacteriota bacterium]
MNKLTEFISRYAKLIMILVLLLTLLSFTQIKNLKVEDDITKYLAENDPEIVFYQEISNKFGRYEENITLVSLEYQDLFTLENLENFKLISEELEKSNYIISVDSFLNMPKIISSDYGIEIRDFVEVFPETEEEVQELKESALNDNMIRGTYLSADGQVGLLMVKSPDNVDSTFLREDLEEIINKYGNNLVKVEYIGFPVIDVQINEMARDNMSLASLATLVVLALLFYCFRSIPGTLLPISIALITSFWLLSSIASTGKTVTIVISAIPVLMIALVTAYGIHFTSRYYEERNLFPPQEAIKRTIVSVFMPILMSALTTMAGFVSLTTAVIRPMTEFGIFATIGILLSFFLTIFFLGAFFNTFISKKVPPNFSLEANDLITRLLKVIAQSIFSKKNWILGIIIIIITISGIFALQVKPDSSIEGRLGENNPITKTMDYFKEKLGGVDFLYIYVTADNVKHPYILRSMDMIQNYASQLPSLSQPSSITTFLAQLNAAMENKKIIPANPSKIDNLWFLAGDNDYINSMLADENQSTIIQIRARELTSNALNKSIEELEKFIQTIPHTVSAIDLASLPSPEKEPYLSYIIENIISSWQANGLKIDLQQEEELQKKLRQIATLPNEYFYSTQEEFIAEILQISTLELEDLGISTKALQPILFEYLAHYYHENQFLTILTQKLNLSLEDAQYLTEILTDSLLIVAEREKIRYAQTEIESILDTKLNEENAEYLWYLTDDYVYVPDTQGDIHFSGRLTGIPVIINEVNNSVFQGQIKSMLAAFIIVFILMTWQFGSLLTGFIAMIPIICTILTAFGIMGIAKISLNIGTMMVASIAIGAGIDYTIHFINRCKQELAKNKELLVAIKITLTSTGRAIAFNSLSVAAGAFVLTLSEIKMISEFAGLIGWVMLISVVYTLLLLPLLLKYTKFKEGKDVK